MRFIVGFCTFQDRKIILLGVITYLVQFLRWDKSRIYENVKKIQFESLTAGHKMTQTSQKIPASVHIHWRIEVANT